MISNQDIKYMNYAINLAKKNIGLTAKNPSVGCVIVSENKIIATAVTQKDGRPHAERMAIDNVKNKKLLNNATLYVTLEPCINNKNKSCCCDYIIENNISRVVIAMQDPNKEINGNSIKKLEKHNIKVEKNILSSKAQKINLAFSYSQNKKIPYITLKLATSLDGKIATKNMDSKWITSIEARKYSHFLRSINDGILIGSNTARLDSPKLDCRIKGLEEYSPKIFILSNKMNFKEDSHIFTQSNNNIYLISPNSENNIKKFKRLNKNTKLHHITFNDKENYLNKIYDLGIKSLLVEGGSNLATQLIKNNIVNKLIWIRNKKIIGNDGLAAVDNLNINYISELKDNFKKVSIRNFESDTIEIFHQI